MREIEVRRGKGTRGKKMFIFLSGLTTFSPYVHFPKVVDLSQLDFDPQHPQKIVRQSISKSCNDTTTASTFFVSHHVVFVERGDDRGAYPIIRMLFFLSVFETPKQLFD